MLLGIPDFTNFRIRGTIAGVCADTKGAHEIGGFLGPSANRFCRLCLITREEIKQKSCFDQLEMRTRENYDEAVEASSSNPEKASDTGIRSCCVLNCSKYFHFGVDGETLSSLSIQDLIGIGLKLGPRLKLFKFIELLNKARLCVPTTPTAEAEVLAVDEILSIKTEKHEETVLIIDTENQGGADENPCVSKETVGNRNVIDYQYP
ncbi:uncharacterized protein LOC123467391 [Daphnia magna]|uniref:uncharacterized protein LOC123467391 n=1 Tax=Daphnia magna TaxID=35525 RepID=UPI001E1BBBE2|nr:uncharacterized protein LOC123467391 [Daphnia magna]